MAMEIIKNNPVETLADAKIQEIILQRVQSAWEIAKNSSHCARCYLPDKLAYLLSKYPQLVAHAVGAYYYRDILQMKVCRTMAKFPAKPCSYHIIRFTRCLYAQLLRQQLDFVPCGYEKLPPDSPSTAAEYKAKSLGYKLACGFEILYLEEKKKLTKNPKYPQQFCKQIDEILQTFDEKNSTCTNKTTPDSEEWLNISPEEVGDIIQNKQKELDDFVKSSKPGSSNKAPKDNLFDFMVDDMKQFMSKMSDLDGVNLDEDEQANTSDEDEKFYDDDLGDEDQDPILAQMDAELNQTTMGKSFEKNKGQTDVNLNLVKNFLSSYEGQFGDAGPVINLLSQMNKKKK